MGSFKSQPIFITGLPRSGTSMVAGLLANSGVWSGTTFPGTPENPRGFFEHVVIREQIVKGILRQMKADPLGVRSLPNVSSDLGIEHFDRTIYQILEQDGYTDEAPWLFKDAKLLLLWPIFNKAFPEARWVIVRRPVERVIDSLLNTSFMRQHSEDRQQWQQFTREYVERRSALEKCVSNVFTLEVEQIFQGNYQPLKEIMAWCDLSYEQSDVDAFIDRRHWHYGSPPEGGSQVKD